MAYKTDYEVMTESYSTIPLIRKKQEKAYREALERKILKKLYDYANMEDIQEIYNEAVLHDKLEGHYNISSETKDVFDMAIREAKRDKKHYVSSSISFDKLKYPEEYKGVHIGSYSIIPWVKHKQHEENKHKMYVAAKISKLSGGEIIREYISVLEDAKNAGEKPDKIKLDAIKARMDHIFSLKHKKEYGSYSDRAHINVPASDNEIRIMKEIRYLSLPKKKKDREEKIVEEIDFVKFISENTELLKGTSNFRGQEHIVKEELEKYGIDSEGKRGSKYGKRDKVYKFLKEKESELGIARRESDERYIQNQEDRKREEESKKFWAKQEEAERKRKEKEEHDNWSAKLDERIERDAG